MTGLYVYDLDGKELQHLPAPATPGEDDAPGRLNNVDIVYGHVYGHASRTGRPDIFVASDRGSDKLRVYRVNPLLGFRGQPPVIDRVREFGVPATFDADSEECVAGADPGFGGRHLSADAEGLTTYYGRHGKGYLIASIQGDDTFAVYDRRGVNAHIGSFLVGDGPGVDGVQSSDGAMAINVPLGHRFPKGLFVTHDGIARRLGLDVDTAAWNPRD